MLVYFAFILIRHWQVVLTISEFWVLTASESPGHRKQRPLSANRKSQDDQQDTNVEAQAVVEAMKAENKSLEKRKRDIRSAPGRPEVGSTNI